MQTGFARFLKFAQSHAQLLVDLCSETETMNRARLFQYMEQNGVPATSKEQLLQELRKVEILQEESGEDYSIFPSVSQLVNHYERRQRFTDAKFLRDQFLAIAKHEIDLRKELSLEEPDLDRILEAVERSRYLAGLVRDEGLRHYRACMNLFGNFKSRAGNLGLEERIEILSKANEKHINPLQAMVDPGSTYGDQVQRLREAVRLVQTDQRLLRDPSQELEQLCRRLLLDLAFIEGALIVNFRKMIETAMSLFRSLIEEKSIRDAIAVCLRNLPETMRQFTGVTISVRGRRSSRFTGLEQLGEHLLEVLHKKHLPHYRPLNTPPVAFRSIGEYMIREEALWKTLRSQGRIVSWPQHIIQHFAEHPPAEQLRAIALPLITAHAQVEPERSFTPFAHDFGPFAIRMHDYAVRWENKK